MLATASPVTHLVLLARPGADVVNWKSMLTLTLRIVAKRGSGPGDALGVVS